MNNRSGGRRKRARWYLKKQRAVELYGRNGYRKTRKGFKAKRVNIEPVQGYRSVTSTRHTLQMRRQELVRPKRSWDGGSFYDW